MIELRGVSKRYIGRNFEVPALHDLTLTITDGEYVSIIGRSGSGKSTLMKIIGLLDFDYEGSYRWQGADVRGAGDAVISAARRGIGYIFQDFQLVQRYSVRRNLELAMVIRHGAFSPAEIADALDAVGLGGKAGSFPDELSGGQKQRVAIARAMLGHPRLIVADEPTGALDASTAATIMGLLADIHVRQGCTLLVVTHDEQVAAGAARTVERLITIHGVVGV